MTRKSLLKSWEAAAISENTKGRVKLRKESEESIVASEHLPRGGVNAPRGAYVKGLCCKEAEEFCGTGVERSIVHAVRTKESWRVRRRSDAGGRNEGTA
jgi:hypothetical protein